MSSGIACVSVSPIHTQKKRYSVGGSLKHAMRVGGQKKKLAGMNENRRSYLQVLKSSTTTRGGAAASKEEPAAAVVVQKIAAVHRGVPRPPLRPLSRRRWQPPPPDEDCCREERIADHMEQCMLEEEYRRCNE